MTGCLGHIILLVFCGDLWCISLKIDWVGRSFFGKGPSFLLFVSFIFRVPIILGLKHLNSSWVLGGPKVNFFDSKLVGAQLSPLLPPFARHLVGKICHPGCSFAHHEQHSLDNDKFMDSD